MMKKILMILVALVLVGFIVLQFFGIDKKNPPIVASETLEAVVVVPADISQILGRSCNDCHTNTTIYPWYSNIQPSGWFLKSHIDEGRQKLNFSIFNTYSPQRKSKKLEEICEQVESKEMPLPSYLWIHSESKLTESDAKALCDWAKDAGAKLEAK